MSSDPLPTDTIRTSPPARAWWRRWFPLVWWGFLLILAAAIVLLGERAVDSDVRVVALIVLANLAWLVPLVWLLFSWPPIKSLPAGKRWLLRGVVMAVVAAAFSSIDVDYDGDGRWKALRFTWQADPDEQLATLSTTRVAENWQTTPQDYPRFLGNGYWAEVEGVNLSADWKASPPELLWKQPIGAGWSAFAIVGEYALTQEQRGADELVVCYHVPTGEVVWTHADPSRHDPGDMQAGLGGIGPRATPTIHEGRVYTLGARGTLNCLAAQSGEAIWTVDLATFGLKPLVWADSSSPLIVPGAGLVVVGGGQSADGHSIVAVRLEDGKLAWQSGPPITSYASPVYAEIAGVPQIVVVNESSVGGYDLKSGEELWTFEQPGSSSGSASCSQPIPLPGDQILVSKGYGVGARLAQIERDADGNFGAKLLWDKTVLKTKLSNLVIRDGHAYGLDHTFLSCVEIESGRVKWKKRRSPDFGHGQVLLVGDKLLVTTESGEGVLVECTPKKYVELAAMPMLDEGVCWNNPALSGPLLLVRSDRQAACYRLPLGGDAADDSAKE
ncbi:outer membrane protein assembly factor BamB family protein [Aeoliella sp. SH292]|uniref:outer membrane protein assembly factor BamB family protein n=1 Tax=Aeoliella sp. SH292 TaxID=3454464 RepID=UPI003F9A6AA1